MIHQTRDVEYAERDRLADDEIEVTPEMIEAGLRAFYGFHIGYCVELDEDEIRAGLAAAFTAMLDVRR